MVLTMHNSNFDALSNLNDFLIDQIEVENDVNQNLSQNLNENLLLNRKIGVTLPTHSECLYLKVV